MKILLTSIGTRGDMEPFLAVGELLQQQGHEVVCLMPEQFRPLAEDSGFRFLSLGSEFIDMLNSPTGKAAMGGSNNLWQKIKAYAKMAKEFAPQRKVLMRRQYDAFSAEAPDRVIHHGKTLYGFLWGLENRGKAFFLSPVPYVIHPVKEQSHIMFHSNYGSFLNGLTFKLGLWGLHRSIRSDAKGLPFKIPGHVGVEELVLNQPSLYTISPSLFRRPDYWPDHIRAVGYHERDKTVAWNPSDELLDFVASHPKFILLTFGSMINPDPAGKTALFLKCLSELKIPAIINTAGGGLAEPENYDHSQFLFVSRIPYDWILSKTYAIIHHGGSGTSHMAVKNGCASLVVPHIIDQFFWNNLLAKLNIGPKGVKITALRYRGLKTMLAALWQNQEYKTNAIALGEKLRHEDYREALVSLIEAGYRINPPQLEGDSA